MAAHYDDGTEVSPLDSSQRILAEIASNTESAGAGAGGDASAANQATQITAEQAILAKLSANAMPPGTVKFRSLTVSTTAEGVEVAPLNLYAWNIINLHSEAIFVKFYNEDYTTVDATDAPVLTLFVAANGSATMRSTDLPVYFDTAAALRVTTGSTDYDTTAAGTLPIIELEYKA